MQTTRITRAPQDPGGEVFESWMRQRAPHEERLRALWAMTPAERRAAMYRRELTYPQLNAWAAARPEEVPLLNGEFWFIAIDTPEAAEPDQYARELRRRYEAALRERKRKR